MNKLNYLFPKTLSLACIALTFPAQSAETIIFRPQMNTTFPIYASPDVGMGTKWTLALGETFTTISKMCVMTKGERIYNSGNTPRYGHRTNVYTAPGKSYSLDFSGWFSNGVHTSCHRSEGWDSHPEFFKRLAESGKWNFTLYTWNSSVRYDDIWVEITGETTTTGDNIVLDIPSNTLGTLGSGELYKHVVEKNVSYSIKIYDNRSNHDTSIDTTQFKSVGVAYLDNEKNKQLAVINQEDTTTVSTIDGELQFFLIDDNANNDGQITINIKNSNLD
ncbi:hypothetical protein EK599_21240 [Vibrio sp. T187]|uniref:hypothetical protein n=1 Tax=Vibrio TaxID=662 RepID=UPI0010C97634|nr:MULTISPECIES: hypothetical protein [Vibrio]MBW3698202.1 hypothetical protein [Vibrio sp. T187]